MALMCEPKLLIADEPTTALDVTIQAQILDVLDNLREKFGMATMLITHDMGVIAGRADRMIVMYAGLKVEVRPKRSSTRCATPTPRRCSPPSHGSTLERTFGSSRSRGSPLTSPVRSSGAALHRDAARPSPTAGSSHRRSEGPTGTSSPASIPFRVLPRALGSPSTARGGKVTRAPLLVVDHLVKDFRLRSNNLIRRERQFVSAVADLSFEVKEGETLGLVGESGCGKTTVGRLIVGLEEPTSGTIHFEGRPEGVSGHRAKVADARLRQMMFQDPYASLNPRMRVRDIIAEPLEIQRDGSTTSRTRAVLELLDEVGLPAEAAERYPHEFSGGQRQRIGFARALALKPKMIIADEPVSSLDVSIQAQILNLMQDLRVEHGLSYIFISHDLAVVRYIADRIGVMYLGKLVVGAGLRRRRAGGVADEVERDDDEDDRDAGGVDLPPVAVERVARSVREHRAPVGLRRGHSEADEAERCKEQDRVRHLERRVDDDRPDRVRNDVTQHDPPVRPAHHAHGHHVLAYP